MKAITFLLIHILTSSAAFTEGVIGDLPARPELWKTSDKIGIEAILFKSIGSLKVDDPEAIAVIRVYLINHRDHPIKYVGTNVDSGFEISRVTGDGREASLKKYSDATEVRTRLLAPGQPTAFNIYLDQKDITFFKDGTFRVKAKIYDPYENRLQFVETPINL